MTLCGTADLFHQTAKVGFFDLVQPTAAILCGKAERVQRVANKRSIGIRAIWADFGHGDDFIDDAGEFVTSLGAVDLGNEGLAIEIIKLLVEDPDEPDVLATGVLKVREPGDHLLAMQAVSASHVGLARALRNGLRLPLGPLETQTSRNRYAVDKDGLVLIQRCRIAKLLTNRVIVGLAIDLIVTQGRVWAADEDREITALNPGTRANSVSGPAFDRQVPCLQIEEQGGLGIQRPKKRGFADA